VVTASNGLADAFSMDAVVEELLGVYDRAVAQARNQA
jgi:hypothetical protein